MNLCVNTSLMLQQHLPLLETGVRVEVMCVNVQRWEELLFQKAVG
jgi:hypothetical protein